MSSEKEKLSSGNYANSNETSEPVQQCVAGHEDKAKPEEKPKVVCRHSQLKITSDKETKTISASSGPEVLKLVSGFNSNKKKVDCLITDLEGPCESHKLKTFDLLQAKQSADNNISFQAESAPFYRIFSNGTIFPWKAQTNSRIIRCNTCGGSLSVPLTVYPDVSMKIDIPLNFGKKSGWSKGQDEKNRSVERSSRGEALKITARYSEDGHDWDFSQNLERKFEKIRDVSKLAEQGLDKLRDALGGSIEVEYLLPQGSVHLDFSYKQLGTGTFEVDSEYHVQLKFSPFIGASANFHIDEIALQLIGGAAGRFYSSLKRRMEAAGGKFGINLVITGQIGFDIGFKKEVTDKTESGTGYGGSGEIEADMKAECEYEKSFIITVKANAEVGLKAGLGASISVYASGSDVYKKIQLKFTGVTFHAQFKMEGGTKEQGNDRLARKREESKGGNATSGGFGIEKVIVDEKTWDKIIKVT